jgi:hypothetical protein
MNDYIESEIETLQDMIDSLYDDMDRCDDHGDYEVIQQNIIDLEREIQSLYNER